MEEKIIIRTLGEFSITYNGVTVSDKDNRSKKIWTLLEYLITFNMKEIPTSNLIDLLWTEDSISSAPENALKTSLHRARGILAKLNHPEKLILHRRDTFKWNTDIPFELDAIEFERCCLAASNQKVSAEERLLLYDKAFWTYHGDYLPNAADDDWALPVITYYHSLYIKMIHEACSLLLSKREYETLINYCCTATAIDPYDEGIHYHLVLSLYRSGKQKAAKEHYERVINLFYDSFGTNPSRELIDLYQEIIKEENVTEVDLGVIQSELIEMPEHQSAYLCDYSVFQHIYHIEARSISRTGLSIYLCLITVELPERSTNQKLLTAAMTRICDIIGHSLRSGDVYSRYSLNQYIIMLPTATYENGLSIGDRILGAFSASRPKINVKVSFTLKHLEPICFQASVPVR